MTPPKPPETSALDDAAHNGWTVDGTHVDAVFLSRALHEALDVIAALRKDLAEARTFMRDFIRWADEDPTGYPTRLRLEERARSALRGEQKETPA